MDSIIFKAISDVGLIRDNNEDSFIAELLWDDHHILCAAIDGVGGYEGGEVAAEIARSTIVEFLNNYPDNNLQDVIAQAVLQANNNIYEQRKKGQFPNMSCVVSAAIIDAKSDKVYIAHVGDSRIYLYNKGILTKISHDHSLVGYREEIGELTEEEAMNHPRRNIIERCLGENERIFGDGNFIDSAVFDIPADGKLIFCSDGLTDMVTQAEIKQILSTDRDTTSKCQMLVDCAKSHGGKDNVTVVLVETTTRVVSSKETVVSYEGEDNKAEREETDNSMKSTADNVSEPNTKKCYGWILWLIPVITLAIGYFIGSWFWKHEEPLAVNQEPYSWLSICNWIEETQPVDTTGYALCAVGDSIRISLSEYYQLKFYDDNIRKIIHLKQELSAENDSLQAELFVKDSLLNEAKVNYEKLSESLESLIKSSLGNE